MTPFLNMLAGTVLLAGCNLSVDASLIRQGDAGDEPDGTDAGELVVDPELDSGPEPEPELDADTPPDRERDANVAPEPEAAVPMKDASPEVDTGHPDRPPLFPEPEPGCDDDDECEAGEFCGYRCYAAPCAPEPPDSPRACRPRCIDSFRGCAEARVYEPERTIWTGEWAAVMAAAGETVYWSTPPESDTLGNPLNGGRIWSWRHTEPASAVKERESGELLLIADDYLYFRRPTAPGAPPSVLFRRSLSGQDSPATQLATNVVKAWKTPTHVVWARKEGASEELWRQSRTSATPAERVAVTQEGHWSSSNSTLAIKSLDRTEIGHELRYRFTIIRLSDQVQVGSLELDWTTERALADEDYLYFVREGAIRRAPFANLSEQLIIATGFRLPAVHFELDGSWVYWWGDHVSGEEEDWYSGMGRSQRDLMVSPPEELKTPGGGARIKNEIFYISDRHIFRKSMPPLPCSPAMACPADMSCSASMVCE